MRTITGCIMRKNKGANTYFRVTYTNKDGKRVQIWRTLYEDSNIDEVRQEILEEIKDKVKCPDVLPGVIKRKNLDIDRLNKPGVVYLIEAIGTDRYKIGMSASIDSRLQGIKNSCPFDIRIRAIAYVKDMLTIEKQLHSKYAEYRITGEWFRFDKAFVAEVESHIVSLSYKKFAAFTR